MTVTFKTPVLFLVFNRPDETYQVFQKIREIKPFDLFIAADGPRNGNRGDIVSCEKTRQVVQLIDWDCNLRMLFRDKNLGCGKSVSSAITWFFEAVTEGIILEDDCLPNEEFFIFCEKLLEKYRNDHRIMHISGRNNLPVQLKYPYSSYFSAYTHIWGWATWRRAWNHYSYLISDLENFIDKDSLRFYFRRKMIKTYWYTFLKEFRVNPMNTWDYQWTYSMWKNQGVSILPAVNLVTNIGFNENATHTQIVESTLSDDVSILSQPFNVPKKLKLLRKADELYFHSRLKNIPTRWQRFKIKTGKMLGKLRIFSNQKVRDGIA